MMLRESAVTVRHTQTIIPGTTMENKTSSQNWSSTNTVSCICRLRRILFSHTPISFADINSGKGRLRGNRPILSCAGYRSESGYYELADRLSMLDLFTVAGHVHLRDNLLKRFHFCNSFHPKPLKISR